MTERKNRKSYGESPFPWEQDALDFVRDRLPANEPYRAWSLFEFIARDGTVNEVDLLVYAPYGFFLIEIKSRPGRLTGDAGTWTWETDGRRGSTDNPLKLANLKAKKLRELLEHHNPGLKKRIRFIEPLVFLSAPDLRCDLSGTGNLRVCLRDRDEKRSADGRVIAARPGIMAAIRQRNCPGLDALTGRPPLDRPTAKIIARAMEEAGIHQSNRQRRVSDYVLDRQIDEGSRVYAVVSYRTQHFMQPQKSASSLRYSNLSWSPKNNLCCRPIPLGTRLPNEWSMQIKTILDQIDIGATALPEFQRGYVWNREQVRGLMYSLYRKHPVGSLLVWVTSTDNAEARGDQKLQPGAPYFPKEGAL